MKQSLRTRLLLAYAGLILAGFAALAFLAGGQISAGTVQDFTQGMLEQTQLVARALKEPVEHVLEGDESWMMLQARLQTYAEQANAQVILLDGNGRFWLSSDGTTPSDTASTPEVLTAAHGQVSSDTRNDIVYTAAPILDDEDLLAIVQLVAPLSKAQTLIWERWLALGGSVLVLTATAVLASLGLAASLTRPLGQLRLAALQVAQGDFTQRLPTKRQDEIGQVATAFNHMAAQIEAMLEEQRAFASNASHELRTPLTTIRLRSEALRSGMLDTETAQQYIGEIDDEVQRLGNLVQDLIMLSRLDTGRMEAGHAEIDAQRLARQLLAELQGEAEARRITLTLQCADNLPPLAASLSHLQMVFRNLLSNALKYTPDGGQIWWEIRAANHTVQHIIRDNGQGIAAEDLPHLFDRFYRADKSRSRAVPGVGLGLSLTKMIVESYNGRITISSEGIGRGTAVTVEWPVVSIQ
ncbi:MAG: HAMP domain-containing protein [Ardenticatenaceae bacterium]|nr:HAMP domain-containing protein [Anaerolineales bacterium]MCB8923743.1 HAMP domain-containing protein [Ardenticatenaceae bacterium]MCB8990078.1 HAMP domain-containing protein [Ardenticatenaceae bacterium]